jgi:hypothetical protein
VEGQLRTRARFFAGLFEIQAYNPQQGFLYFLRESPQNSVDGPTLVYKRAKNGQASFYCSHCGLSFVTKDPLEAYIEFTNHSPQCNPKKQRKIPAAS